MYSRVLTASIYGIGGELTWAEVDAENGLPAFTVVGLGSQSVKEARERIRSALGNCGFDFPTRRITVNLTPANKKKDGSHYDLPVAVGLLLCTGSIKLSKRFEDIADGKTACLGELTLDGRIAPVEGVLPMIAGLKSSGVKTVFIPYDNRNEASLIKGIDIVAAKDLRELTDYLEGYKNAEPIKAFVYSENNSQDLYPDFSDIKGQESVKRAAQIAAAGMHGLLLVGPPGVGKTMIGKRISGLLEALTYEEMIEVTRLYSVAGELKNGSKAITVRPFRAPHHSISRAALIGGGNPPRPGEISLADHGVLFLDELAEFPSGTLDALRQPLEDGFVTINRVNSNITYPAKFMLVGAMNPCRCGYYGDPVKACSCTESDRKKYAGRVSGPLLDRIDIHVSIHRTVYDDIISSESKGSSTEDLKRGVATALEMQKERYKGLSVNSNSQLNAKLIEKYCETDAAGKAVLKTAFEHWHLSARSFHRVLKLSRTVADMSASDRIREEHVLEALQYRFPEDFLN